MEEEVATAEEKQQQRDEANDGHTANSHPGRAGDARQLYPPQLPPETQGGVRLPPAAAYGKVSIVTQAAAADWWLRLIARWEPGTIRSSGAGTPT